MTFLLLFCFLKGGRKHCGCISPNDKQVLRNSPEEEHCNFPSGPTCYYSRCVAHFVVLRPSYGVIIDFIIKCGMCVFELLVCEQVVANKNIVYFVGNKNPCVVALALK